MKVDARALETAARSDAEFDGWVWAGISRLTRERYIARSQAAITAYLASLPGAGAGDHIGDVNKMVAPAGWKLVPTEPTTEMRMAARKCTAPRVIYKAMIAAAPASPAPASMPSEEK